jgi:hypothetical protein
MTNASYMTFKDWNSTNATYNTWAYNQTLDALGWVLQQGYYNSTTLPSAYDWSSFIINNVTNANTSLVNWISTNPFNYYNATNSPAAFDWSAYIVNNVTNANTSLVNWLDTNPYGYMNTTYNATYNTWAYNQTLDALGWVLQQGYYNSMTLPSNFNKTTNDTLTDFMLAINQTLVNWADSNPWNFLVWGIWFNQTNTSYMTFQDWNSTNESYCTWDKINMTNASYVTWDALNMTNTSYMTFNDWNSTNTSYMTFQDWNSTNTSYYLASNPSNYIAYGSWINQTNESYGLNATFANVAWNMTNTSYALNSSLSDYMPKGTAGSMVMQFDNGMMMMMMA